MIRRLAVAVAVALLAPIGVAQADTLCTMGSPTPGFRVIRMDLPQGSSYIGLEMGGSRTFRPVDDGSSWHFARGIMVLDSNFELVTYRLVNSASHPKRYVVGADDERVAVDAPGADGPFVHESMRLIPHLDPGVYYAVGFGVDGSSANPNEYWTANVRVQGTITCSNVAAGETFDLNQTDAEKAGVQVYVPGAGVAEDGEFSYISDRQMSVGLLDCSIQFNAELPDDAGELGKAECEVDLPNGSTVQAEDEVVPFLAGPGTSTVSFDYLGASPVVTLAGASFDILG